MFAFIIGGTIWRLTELLYTFGFNFSFFKRMKQLITLLDFYSLRLIPVGMK